MTRAKAKAKTRLESKIYYNGRLLFTVIHPLSVTNPREARQDVREKIIIATNTQEPK